METNSPQHHRVHQQLQSDPSTLFRPDLLDPGKLSILLIIFLLFEKEILGNIFLFYKNNFIKQMFVCA